MAYRISQPNNSEQDLEEWYQLALQQRESQPLASNAFAAESPFTQPSSGALPVNYAQTSSGTHYDFGPSQPQSNALLNWNRPYRTMDGRKGYLGKDNPNTVYDPYGDPIAQLSDPVDRGQQLKYQNAEADLLNKKLEAQRRQQEMTQFGGMGKPPKDMRWNVAGELEPIPGSVTHQKLLKGRSDADAALSTQDQWTDSFIKNIDQLIGDEEKGTPAHPGLAGSVGWVDANMPPISYTPKRSTDQATAKAMIKALLAKASVQGLQGIRQSGTAPGSITEKEWPIFQNLINTLDPTQDLETFTKQLQDARMLAKEAKQRSRQRYQQQFNVPDDGLSQVLMSVGAVPQANGYPTTGMRQGGNPAPVGPMVNTGQDLTPPRGRDPREDALLQEGLDAINRGADPVAVRDRLRQMGIQLR